MVSGRSKRNWHFVSNQMNNYFKSIFNQVGSRSLESTLSILSITQPGLRQHLFDQLAQSSDGRGFLADPVFEAIFPWKMALEIMDDLGGNLLADSLIDAMDSPPKSLAEEYAFRKVWSPYVHQLHAWKILTADKPKSVVVTSGTGSGKTECFMVPVLNDLVREHEENSSSLVGVRALFIYPLNALINSQRDRLRAWTHNFDDSIRFSLYNGNTPDNVKQKIQSEQPNEILSRKLQRESPAPILVTNATMLEYMLVRQVDRPIIDKSQGKLRWIVLDEAHSYIGSQAAELSLLLRRVMFTFGVNASDVRFVATSATIGDGESDNQLAEYLASLAGISPEQVVVIGGSRDVPELPEVNDFSGGYEGICSIEPGIEESADRYTALAGHQTGLRLRKSLASSKLPKTLTQITGELFGEGKENEIPAQQRALEWLDLCSSTRNSPADGRQPFIPLRGHLFHQVLSGLWCCSDVDCQTKKQSCIDASWPFGYVYASRRVHCECGSPVYELLLCEECNTPYLRASDVNHRLVQYDHQSLDEFSLQIDESEDSDNAGDRDDNAISENLIICPFEHIDRTFSVGVSRQDLQIGVAEDSLKLHIADSHDLECLNCNFEGYRNGIPFRHCLLGTPFYIGKSVPTLLEYCQDGPNANERPARGRRMITFTDSRQGTARIATKLQQDSQREKLRGLVYGIAGTKQSVGYVEGLEDKRKKLESYKAKVQKFRKSQEEELADSLSTIVDDLEADIDVLSTNQPVSWEDMVTSLQSTPDVSTWILDYYRDLNPILFSQDVGARTPGRIHANNSVSIKTYRYS